MIAPVIPPSIHIYGGMPIPHVAGISGAQLAAHEALHGGPGLLLAILDWDCTGAMYCGTVITSGEAAWFKVEGCGAGRIGPGADISLDNPHLILGSTLTIFGMR